MAEDEDLRIDALRQEIMREVDAVKNDVEQSLGGLMGDIKNLKWLLGILIAVFALIATILALAANII